MSRQVDEQFRSSVRRSPPMDYWSQSAEDERISRREKYEKSYEKAVYRIPGGPLQRDPFRDSMRGVCSSWKGVWTPRKPILQ